MKKKKKTQTTPYLGQRSYIEPTMEMKLREVTKFWT